MFTWPAFRELASAVIDIESDNELRTILLSTSQPARTVDDVGRPLPNSALINQHPDPENYSRIIRIRKTIAVDKNAQEYVKYADVIIRFLDSFGPFSEVNPLWLVLVATHKNEYEFLFAPQKNALIGMPVGHLRNADVAS